MRQRLVLSLIAVVILCGRGMGQSREVFEAARAGDTEKVRELGLDSKSVNVRGELGRTPLHEAAAHCRADTVRLLLEAGANRRALDDSGATPADLVMPCAPDTRSSLYLLLGPPPQEQYPWSLQYAVAHKQVAVISMLLGLGVDVNARGSEGNRPLNIACLAGNAPIARLLLEHGADPNLPTMTGAAALHDAALAGNAEVIEVLLEHGAKLNAIDPDDGSTPLHLAASFDRLDAVKALVERGADITAKNAKGLTAGDLASKNHFADVSEFLAARTRLPGK